MNDDELRPELSGCMPNSQVQAGELLFEISRPEKDRIGGIDVVDLSAVRQPDQHFRVERVADLSVDMRSHDDGAQELAEGKCLLIGAVGAANGGDLVAAYGAELLGDEIEGISPGGDGQLAGCVAY